MKRSSLSLAACLLPLVASAQEYVTTSSASANFATKVVHVRNASASRLAQLISPGVPVRVDYDDSLQVLVLKGKPSDLQSAEQLVRELDVQSATLNSKSVELTVSVIGASMQANALSNAVPAGNLSPVIGQLKAIFPYSNYQVLSSMLVRSAQGSQSRTSGIMKIVSDNPGITYAQPYNILYDSSTVYQEGSNTSIHLKKFSFEILSPLHQGDVRTDVLAQTDVDLREGQKIVVGKANLDNDELALFVVLTARLVD